MTTLSPEDQELIERLKSIAEQRLEFMKFMVDRIADLESALAQKEAAMEKRARKALVAYFDATSKRNAALSALAVADAALAKLIREYPEIDLDIACEARDHIALTRVEPKGPMKGDFCQCCKKIFEGACSMGGCPMGGDF